MTSTDKPLHRTLHKPLHLPWVRKCQYPGCTLDVSVLTGFATIHVNLKPGDWPIGHAAQGTPS